MTVRLSKVRELAVEWWRTRPANRATAKLVIWAVWLNITLKLWVFYWIVPEMQMYYFEAIQSGMLALLLGLLVRPALVAVRYDSIEEWEKEVSG